ncbi:MAG TPA: hypothetical protein VFG04_15035 [Planctomycetaceae bacterium]|jgi:hypothetical protein|nr:hypothetical protein [Planctomycetaceae bacterium]
MFVHWAKHIHAERVGGRVVRVACARCDCEYFYKFARVGVGSGTAHYGLGVDRATRSANNQAQKDLERRLAAEAELVPCPKCHWINDQLVAGFRLGRYRNVGQAAKLIAGIAGILALVLGVSCAVAAPASLVYFLIVPAGLFAAAGGLLLLRNGLRNRIQPNRDHPSPPQLPPGSPPALVLDPESGQLVTAKQGESLDVSHEWVDFQVGRQSWPLVCCDCLQPGTLERGHRMMVTNTMKLTIPRCEGCAHSARRDFRRIWWNVATIGILVTAAIVIPLNLDWAEFWIVSGVLLLIAFGIGVFVARKKTAPAKIADRDRSRAVVRLQFRNADYTRVVAQHLNR